MLLIGQVFRPCSRLKARNMTRIVDWTYPGGKGGVGVYQNIINCMPQHDFYIEAFLGAGAVFRHKKPARGNLGIDLDEKVIRTWAASGFPSLEVIHGDAFEILSNWRWQDDKHRRTLIYCDPPYLKQTRSSRRPVYRCDLTSDEAHTRLLQILLRLPCMVMLSGYRSALYESIIGHWRQVHFPTVNRAGKPTVETIWMNFPAPSTLHDYRYLGQGFRERERIKRRRERWKARLLRMPLLERQAVLLALHEVSSFSELHPEHFETNSSTH
jgi:DNA adenine methylase